MTTRHRGIRDGFGAPDGGAVAVSVGMAAYNAAQTIRPAIESLLCQRFADFELIISDNASTDATWSIIQEYAASDSRIVAIRQERNVGANGNFTATFAPARGRYFKWASANDWCDPALLGACVSYLDQHSDTVLVAPRTRLFRETPAHWEDYEGDVAFDDDSPAARFVAIATRLALNNVVTGLFRSATLRATPLIEHYPGADIVLLSRVALAGKIALLDEPLHYRRMTEESATALMDERARQLHHYPSPTLKSLFPAWRFAGGWLRAACSGRLAAGERRRVVGHALRMAYWSSGQLWRDLR